MDDVEIVVDNWEVVYYLKNGNSISASDKSPISPAQFGRLWLNENELLY